MKVSAPRPSFTVLLHDTTTRDPDEAVMIRWVVAENAIEAFKRGRESLRRDEYEELSDDEWRDHKGAIFPVAVYPRMLWDLFPHGSNEALAAIG